MGSQKKRKKKKYRAKSAPREYDEATSITGGYNELLDLEDNKILRKLPSYVGYIKDLGKEKFAFSNCRTRYDFSPSQKKQIRRSPQGIVLVVLVGLLITWFFASLFYRAATEDAGKVMLSMLPSFIIIAAITAIVLISYFGAWGNFLRFAYRHRLVRGSDAASRAMHRQTRAELGAADLNRLSEYAVTVYENYVAVALGGQRYNFDRNSVYLEVKMKNDELKLVFTIDGYSFEFLWGLPKRFYSDLRKTFGDRLTVQKDGGEEKPFSKVVAENIGFLGFGLCFTGVSVLLIVASYLWLPIPPFLGVFFFLMSFFIYCNVLSEITIVSEIGVPLIFFLVLMIIPPWAYVWIEPHISGEPLTFIYFLTHCSPFAAGLSFFWFMGFFTLAFVISKIIDFKRFGK